MSLLMEAYEAGMRLFGENRVLEAVEKRKKLPEDAEIQLMQNWLIDEQVEADVERLSTGDRVHITTGPFKGKKGIVREINKNRIQLLLLDLDLKITLNRPTV